MSEQLIFILAPEPKWGNYVVYPARVTDEGEFYNYLGKFTDEQEVTPEIQHVLQLCQRYEINALYHNYGKKKFKTELDFIAQTGAELRKAIRAFVDKTVTEVICEINAANLPLFLRESRLDNPYKKDRIQIADEPLKPLLGFYRNEEHIRYTLRLSNREKQFIPAHCELKIITIQPGTILIGNDLFRLSDGFSSLRLKPFLTKEEVIIPRQNEQEYFHKFILKNICNEDIEAEGFEVIERKGSKVPVLSLERDILSRPLLELRFRYNNRSILSSSPNPVIVELKEEDGQYRFYKTNRDYRWEEKCIRHLVNSGLQMTSSGHFKLADQHSWSAMVEWLIRNKRELENNEFEISQDRLSVKYYTGNWRLEYTQENTTDWFQLRANVVLDDGRTIPLQLLWEHILSEQREYLLPDNTIFVIPEEWFSRYSGIFLFGQRKENQVTLQRNQFTLLEDESGSRTLLPEIEVDVPSKLRATLRDYQLKGYKWLYNLYRQKMGACLADDMGLGKTIQTISLLLKYKEENKRADAAINTVGGAQLDLFASGTSEKDENPVEKQEAPFRTCLIVAPASVVHNWRNELKKFAPSLTVGDYTGNTRMNMKQALMRWDVIITTYQTLRNDIHFLTQRQFGIVVFDESQSFKNRDSQVHQAVSQIQGDHFIALSGTPIENSLSDLWSLMHVINRGLLGNHTTFQKYFIRPITTDINGLHSQSLRRLISPFILRRTKQEVLQDLPERTDELILCETDPEQWHVYEEELSKARNQLLEQKLRQTGSNKTFSALQAIVRLRQIANHPRMADPDYAFSSGKFREIFRMLEEIADTGHKVLLFSDYVKYLDLIAEEMDSRNWEYAMLTGSTSKREQVIREFSDRSECRFFLISLKAGGVGLNLTEADYVFILDPWWNAAAEEQAISRAHRMGQKQAVFVYRFVTAGTLEEKILNIQQHKNNISETFITNNREGFQPDTSEMEKLLLDKE